MRKSIFFALFLVHLAASSFAISATIDPLEIGVGTRPLGMGKAFVAVADDSNSLFLNPAGLSIVKDWGANSIYSSLISEITYTTLGLYRSSSDEGVGFGLVQANIGGTLYTTYRDPVTDRIVPVPGGDVAVGYSSNVFLFSYGVLLGKYFNFPNSDKLSVGTSFKAFQQQLVGTEEASASGFDLDVGLLYQYNRYIRLGLYGQNILPFESGGALRWDSGTSEDIPSSFKAGVHAKAFGRDAIWDYPQDIYINFDMEGSTVKPRPIMYHIGAEWWLYKYMALRFGIDQDLYSKGAGNGVDNNMTFGLGFWQDDFGFDYAYHQYGPLSENVTHYFSLTYGFPGGKPSPTPEARVPEEYIRIIDPKDKSIIYDETVYINGEVIRDEVDHIVINGQKVEITRISQGQSQTVKGAFSTSIKAPSLGKFLVKVDCYDKDKKILRKYKIRLLRMPSFTDVPKDYWAHDKISLLAMLKLFGGYPDGTFKPEKVITRAELTTLLVRTSGVEVPELKEKMVFNDLSSKHWAAKYVKVGVERGIVTGYRDRTFKPGKDLDRTEGLIMVARFAGIQPQEMLTEKPFSDVPIVHWAAKLIAAAKTEGIIDYLAGHPFKPKNSLTRGEAAEMLSKTKFVKFKADDLFDWDIGFEEEPPVIVRPK